MDTSGQYELVERRNEKGGGYDVYFNGYEFFLPDGEPSYMNTYKKQRDSLKERREWIYQSST